MVAPTRWISATGPTRRMRSPGAPTVTHALRAPRRVLDQDSTHLAFYSLLDVPPGDRCEIGCFDWDGNRSRFHIIACYVNDQFYFDMATSRHVELPGLRQRPACSSPPAQTQPIRRLLSQRESGRRQRDLVDSAAQRAGVGRRHRHLHRGARTCRAASRRSGRGSPTRTSRTCTPSSRHTRPRWVGRRRPDPSVGRWSERP